MLVLVIFAIMFLIASASIVVITIAHESLAIDKTPEWLDTAYYFVWDNLEKIFLR